MATEPSSEFRIPDSELEGHLELRVPNLDSAASASSQPHAPAAGSVPSGMILFPRRMFYVEASLYFVIAVAAFGAGYLVGHGAANSEKQSAENAMAQSRVPVEGRISYDTGIGITKWDEGAVVFVLPMDKSLPTEKRLLPADLRPTDPPPTRDHRMIRRLQDFGGDYARTDKAGNFHLFLPKRGKYRVLIVSNHGSRGPDAPLPATDSGEMERYFEHPEDLIQSAKYRWTVEDFHLGSPALDVELK